MGYHNILSKLDRAIVALIVSQGAGTEADTYPAKRDEDKTLPNTVCIAEDFREEPTRSRCFLIPVALHVRTRSFVDLNETADQVEAASDLKVQQVFDCFYPEEDQDGSVLGRLITEAGRAAGIQDFTCLSAEVKGGDRGQREKDSAWVDTLQLECYCSATNIEED